MMTADRFKSKWKTQLFVQDETSRENKNDIFDEDVEALVKTTQRHTTRPLYAHGHSCCALLVQHGEFDLYYCRQNRMIPTVLARYGDKPSEYFSGAWGTRTDDKDATPPQIALRIAFLIAKDRGLEIK